MWCSETTSHPGTSRRRGSISAPFKGGTPPRHGTQVLLARSVMACSSSSVFASGVKHSSFRMRQARSDWCVATARFYVPWALDVRRKNPRQKNAAVATTSVLIAKPNFRQQACLDRNFARQLRHRHAIEAGEREPAKRTDRNAVGDLGRVEIDANRAVRDSVSELAQRGRPSSRPIPLLRERDPRRDATEFLAQPVECLRARGPESGGEIPQVAQQALVEPAH